jgi:spore maturation protein A
MNVVWTGVMLVGLGLLTINNVDMAMDAMFNGTSKAIALSLKLWGIYTLWLGILKIVEETGLDKKLSKLFKPLIKVLFGKTDDYTSEQISVNLTSNFLGMGNASTPSGINSISGMDKGSKYATSGMIMMIVLNSTSMQLIPTTVVGLRITAGSNSPGDIIIPTLVATIVCAVSGALLVKLFSKIFKDKE